MEAVAKRKNPRPRGETPDVNAPPLKAAQSADIAQLRAAADRLARALADVDEEQVVIEFKRAPSERDSTLMSPVTATTPSPEKPRCPWPGTDPLYLAYHDQEWGLPQANSQALWELLMLEGFQAGLSWITVLRKREAFRAAFHQFDPEKVARYQEADIARLMQNPGIIRARAKIEATILGARIFLNMEQAGTNFAAFAWKITGGKPIQNTGPVPATTPLSENMSKELKQHGFKFVGPTIAYAWMQASGMVNDHAPNCFRRQICAKKQLGKFS